MNRRFFLAWVGALALVGASSTLRAQSALPTISVSSSSGPVAVNGVATGTITFTSSTAPTANLPISYTVSGSGNPGIDYTALSGATIIAAGTTSVSVPVTAAAAATPNATVIASVATTASYQAGTASSATVVLEGTTFDASAQNTYGTIPVTALNGSTVTLTFQGLPSSPTGTVYVWYLNGTAFATSTTGSYSLTNAQVSQSGTYSVYAWTPGGVTGNQSFSVSISSPFTDADVGNPGHAGSESYNSANGTYTVNGGGTDIYDYSDQFNFYSEQVTGNTTLITQVVSQTNTNAYAKAGLMFRDSLASNAAEVSVLENPGGLVVVQWRDADGGSSNSTSQISTGAATNLWLKLVKSGIGISGYFAVTAGVPGTNDWILIATHTTAVFSGSTYLAGFAVTSHDNSQLGTAVFSNFNYAGGNTTPTATAAVAASSFLGSIGVCTHVTQGRDDPTQVPALLTYAGIANVRDDGTTNTLTLASFVNIHNASGAKYCLLPVDGDLTDSLSQYELLAGVGGLLAVEGPNELNNYSLTYNGGTTGYTTTYLPGAQFQRDLYKAVKADTKLAGIPVFAPSEAGGSEPDNVGFQYITIPSGAGTEMPDGTVYADYANTHNYLSNNNNLSAPIANTAWGAEDPTLNGSWDGMYVEYSHTWHKGFSGYPITQLPSIPRVTTETGWVTAPTYTNEPTVTEDQQGKLFLNLFLDAYRRGWAYTFIYMLRDDSSQGYWGLFHSDNTPKLSATYLHNLTTILADSGTSTPGSLSYAIPNEPITVHDMLIQKSNGAYELAVWDEEVSGSDSVTVNLGASAATVNVYDPTVSATAGQVLSNVSAIPLTLSDHPVILEIGAPPPPPVVTVSSSSGPLAVSGVATGTITFTSNTAPSADLPVAYTVSGTGVPGTDYTALSGTVTIAAGTTSASVPVSALPGATPNATVTATIATTSTYTAGTAASASVVLEDNTFTTSTTNAYGSSSVTANAGSNVTLTFGGLPGNPTGTTYIWYLNGTAFTTTTTGSYTLTGALASQSGTYAVYAYAPGGITGSQSYAVNINNPVVSVSSTSPLAVNGEATGTITFTSSFAPTANLPISYTVSGTGVPGTDYTALSASTTIMAGTTSVSVPVTAAAAATPDASVTATIATSSTYTAGSAASATVVLEPSTYTASAQNPYATSTVAGSTGGTVTLTFQGLPGNPTGTVYVWYYNGTAIATTSTGTYSLSNAQIAQSGTYSVYAYAPGGITGSQSFTVTISTPVVLPVVSLSSSAGPLAVSGVATGTITFTSNTAPSADLPVAYTVSGTGVPGTDYTALSGTVTIAAGTTSASVPVTALPGATPNATVTATIATTSTYTAGTAASASVVLEDSTFTASATNAYGSSSVTANAGSNVTLTFGGLPGNPTGATYIWYLNGTAFTTTATGSYTLTGALASQSGTYAVYAYAPGGITGSQSYAVTINNPVVSVSSTSPLAVNGEATGTITFTSSFAPTSNLPISYTVSGTGVPGTDYTALSGSATILAGTTSVSVPVTAAVAAAQDATVIATIATTSTYTAGSAASATVVLEPSTYTASAQNPYATSAVSGSTGGTVTLTFAGLPGNPSGTVYVWYYNGTAIATTTTGTYSLSNAQIAQSGTYSVYAYAPGGITGSQSFTVTISTPVVLPIVTVSSTTAPLAVNGVATGTITFTSNTAPSANLPIAYTVSGTGVPGTDYTALSGTVTIAAGTTSASVPVTALPGATPNATVTATVATTSTYTAGTAASASVVLEDSTFNASTTNAYGSGSVTANAGSNVTLTFGGLPGNPTGTIYIWYLNGTAFTTTTGSYTLTGALASQSGTYAVYAYAPGGVTGSQSYAVTINNPVISVSNTSPLAVNGEATGTITFTSSFAPTANLPISYTVSGTGVPGTDYTALSGSTTILAGTTSASVPVTAAPAATPNATVIATIATTSTYTAGTPSSATVALEGSTYSASTQNPFTTSTVTGSTGGTVTLTFSGLPGNPTGTVYIWYYNGAAIATTSTGTYSLTNAQIAQSGTYSVYAYAPGGITGSQSFTVTISTPVVLPIVTLSSTTAPLAVNGVATGTITFTSNTAPSANLPVAYTVSGTGVPGTDYTALSGTVTIVAGTTSASVPVTALPGATPNATVTATIATTSTYTAGTAASASVVLEDSTFTASTTNAYSSSNVTANAGSNVTLTFQGLPGNPTGTIYIWYLNGTAFTTTATGSYTLTGALASQSGTYAVYAYAPGGVTGSQSYAVTINNPVVSVTSTSPLAVNGEATGTITFTSSFAPTANLPLSYTVSGTGVPGTDYTALSGSTTILAGTTSVSVPVTAAPAATPNATVIATIATTSTYTAGTPSSATVALEGSTYSATSQNPYTTSAVAGSTGGTVTLTFQGLPGNPTGTVYVWYYNGTAIATTTTGTFTLSNAQIAQSGTYSVYAYAPGGITGSQSFTVTISTPVVLPVVSLSSTSGPLAVNGVATGTITFTSNTAPSANLPVAYTVSGTGVPGTDYTALSGTVTIAAGTTSASVPVTALPGATPNATVTATIATTSTYTAGTAASASVVLEDSTFTASTTNAYSSSNVTANAGSNVTLTFQGLPGNPTGTIYIWYLNGTAFTTTATGSYTLTGALASQSGTYAVYAYAPGGVTGSQSYAVTINNPVVSVTSTSPLAVNGEATGTITFTSSFAPTANLPLSYTVSGTGVPGTDYTALSGSATILAGTTSVSVPVTAAPAATPNATVIATIATTSTYTAGTPSSATVALEGSTYSATSQNPYTTSAVAGSTGGTVTLTFQGLPGNPTGTVYVWYYNGTAIATTTTGTFTLSNAQIAQSGTYSVYAYAPGGITGSQSFTVTISTPVTSSFTDADIGGPSPAGSGTYNSSNGTYTVSGGGADIYGNADQFNFYSESVTGNATLVVRVNSQTNTSVWAKAGLMFRNDSTAGSAWVGVFQNPGNLVEMQWRDSANGGANWPGSQVTSAVAANWLELVKTGTTYSAYYATTSGTPSANNWILIATHTTSFTSTTFLGGLAVTSHNNGVLGTAVFSGFTYPGSNTTPALPIVTVSSSTGPLAVNGVATGTITFTSNTAPSANLPISYTVSGTGVPGTDYTALSGTATILAGTTSVSVPVTAAVAATPNATVTATIATTSTYTAGSPSSATVVLEGTTYSATAQNPYGTSAVSGSTGGTVTLTFSGLPGSPSGTVYVWYYNGTAIATTTTGTYTLNSAQIAQSGTYSVYAYAPGGITGSQSFTVTITTPTTPTSTFTDADIGGPSPAGSGTYTPASGTYTINGGGADIYGAADQFNFYSESITGNATLVVRVNSQTNTSVWAKAGLMFRNDSTAGSAWVGVFQNPGNLVEMQWRDSANGGANWPGSQVTSAVAANWLELVKTGTTYSAYYATTSGTPSANNWILIATHTTSFTSTTFLAGLAVTSHNNGVLGTAVFSGFTYPGSNTTPALPIVTVSSSTGQLAVNGVATGTITFTSNTAPSANLPISYTVSGTGVPGTDYTALSGSTTILAGTTSVNVPVTAAAAATPNATVTATIATTSTYTAGSPSSATVVLEGTTYSATAQNPYGTSAVAGSTGGTVTLTFSGLPGSPSGTVYVWYYNGTAIATTTTGTYSLSNAQIAQSGTYSVYAYAPGGITGSQSFTVTITTAPLTILTSTGTLTVNDGSSNSFFASLASAPTGTVTVNVAVSGDPALTVSTSTLTMTPTNYQNQTVTVSAAAINSNDSARTGTVALTSGLASTSVSVTDAISDSQTAANLTGTSAALTGSNIGAGAGDSSVHASGDWWIDGSGTGGLASTADGFHFESQSYTGNFQMVVQLQNLVATGASAPLAGLMIRDGTAAGSNFLAIAGTTATAGGYSLISRTTVNAATTTTVTSGTNMTYTYPNAWMMLSRVGSVLHAYVSSDGVNFYEVTNPTTGVTWTSMSTALNIGVFASSGNSSNTRAVMLNFAIIAPATTTASFTDADIGGPSPAGSGSYNSSNGTYTVSGGGADIYGAADQFNYYSESTTGNATLVVNVNSQTNTSVWAKAGLMFRNDSTAGSAWVGVFQNPGNLLEMQWRDSANAQANWPGGQVTSAVAANWLELVKTGNSFSAYYATTSGTPSANNWILIATHTTSFTSSTFLAGLAVTSHNNGVLGTAVFSGFTYPGGSTSTSTTPTLPIVTLSSNTAAVAVNGVATGTITFTSNTAPTSNLPITYTVSGSANPGTDYIALTGSTTIPAGTTSVSVPVSALPGATSNATVTATIATTATYQAGTASSATVVLENATYNAAAQNAYGTSAVSGSTGSTVGLTFQGLPGNPTGTVYVWYYNGSAIATTTTGIYSLSNAQTSQSGTYSVYAYAPGGITGSQSFTVTITTATPSSFTDADIGGPSPAGSGSYNSSNATYTVSGGGADIYGNTDQFNFYSESVTGNATLVVRVNSQTNTSVWAKAGLMFRNDSTAGSAWVGVFQNPGNLLEMQWRDSANAGANWPGSQVTSAVAANWLELVKTGTTYSAYYATTTSTPSANNWILIATHTTSFTSTNFLGGLAVTSHNNGVLGTAVFSGFTHP